MKKQYRQLTLEERYQIATSLTHEMSLAAIAKILKRPTSTISREIRAAGGRTQYRADQAHREMERRRRQARKANRRTPSLIATVKSLMEFGLSPEQISNRMVLEESKERVSHEWIYRYVLEDKQAGGDLWTYLRQRGKRYRKHAANWWVQGLMFASLPRRLVPTSMWPLWKPCQRRHYPESHLDIRAPGDRQ